MKKKKNKLKTNHRNMVSKRQSTSSFHTFSGQSPGHGLIPEHQEEIVNFFILQIALDFFGYHNLKVDLTKECMATALSRTGLKDHFIAFVLHELLARDYVYFEAMYEKSRHGDQNEH